MTQILILAFPVVGLLLIVVLIWWLTSKPKVQQCPYCDCKWNPERL